MRASVFGVRGVAIRGFARLVQRGQPAQTIGDNREAIGANEIERKEPTQPAPQRRLAGHLSFTSAGLA